MLISPTLVSEASKCIILDILTRKQFRRQLFDTLQPEEKQTIEHLIHVIGYDKELEGYSGPKALAELRQNYDIYKGQIEAGNHNPKIKQALVGTITEMVNRKMMGVSHGRQLVIKYSV
jgi:hypothetical protein